MLGSSLAEAKSMLDQLQQAAPRINDDQKTQNLDRKLDKITSLLEKLEARCETEQVARTPTPVSSTAHVRPGSTLAAKAPKPGHIATDHPGYTVNQPTDPTPTIRQRTTRTVLSAMVDKARMEGQMPTNCQDLVKEVPAPPTPIYKPGTAARQSLGVPADYQTIYFSLEISLEHQPGPGQPEPPDPRVPLRTMSLMVDLNCARDFAYGPCRVVVHGLGGQPLTISSFPGGFSSGDSRAGYLLGLEIYFQAELIPFMNDDNEWKRSKQNGELFIWKTLVNETTYPLVTKPFKKTLPLIIYVKPI